MKMDEDEAPDADHLKKLAKLLLEATTDREDDMEQDLISLCQPLNRMYFPAKGEMAIDGFTPKKQSALVLKSIGSLPKSVAKKYFSKLDQLVDRIAAKEAYVPSSALDDSSSTDPDQDDSESATCLQFLTNVAKSARACLDGRVSREKRASLGTQLQMPTFVYEITMKLNNLLLCLHECGQPGEAAQDTILGLCESWWLHNAMYRDGVVAPCLPLLVSKALDGKEFSKASIKRLFHLQQAFMAIDFSNPVSDSLKNLLLRLLSNPLCLRMSEGKKFLAGLYNEPELVGPIHLAIRAQIPHASKSILLAFGDVYHRAWKDLEDDVETRDMLERIAIQDLMYAAVHVAKKGTHKSVLLVLENFHTDKKDSTIAEMFHRLYGPILWRSLSVSNATVRRNAITVLGEVFPLHDPDKKKVRESVERSCAALKTALRDTDPRVRVAAADATGKVCHMYWDVIPASEIRLLINDIVLELASDSSSSAVRAAALDAVGTLLRNKSSHAALRALLPSMGNLIHDKSERVRVATVKLLTSIKQIPGIRFYHVVPVDHLKTRLAEEMRSHSKARNSVAKELTGLLLNSYLPDGSTKKQLERTLNFVTKDPEAAESFYSNVSHHLDSKAMTKLVTLLLAYLKSLVDADEEYDINQSKKKKKKKRSRQSSQADEGSTESEQHSNAKVIARITDTIWRLLETSNSSSRVPLTEALQQGKLARLLVHFESKIAQIQNEQSQSGSDDYLQINSSLLKCAGWLPVQSASDLKDFVLSSLETAVQSGIEDYKYMNSHLAPLCKWGMATDFVQALAASLQTEVGKGYNLLSPRLNESAMETSQIVEFTPAVGRALLDDILRGDEPSSLIVRQQILECSEASSLLENTLHSSIVVAENVLAMSSDATINSSDLETLLFACEAYGRFSLHKEAYKTDSLEISQQIITLLEWTSEKVLPALIDATAGETQLRDIDVSRISSASESAATVQSSPTCSPPRRKVNTRLTPGKVNTDLLDHSDKDPAVFAVNAFATSLVQSSCVILVEALSVKCATVEEIGPIIRQWCDIFFSATECVKEDRTTIATELFPSFLRLSLQLCKSSNDATVLKSLFRSCSLSSHLDESALVTKGIHTLLKCGPIQRKEMANLLAACVAEAATDVVTPTSVGLTITEEDQVDSLWEKVDGCLLAAVDALSSHRDTSLILAKLLVAKLENRGSEVLTNETAFYAKCLSTLTELDGVGTSILGMINASVHRPESEDGTIGSVMQHLTATC